jgi:hypothetical protein
VVVLAHLKTQEMRGQPADRHAWKVRLVKGLYERGLQPEDVRRLFRFIDWIMDLPKGLDAQFWDEIHRYEEEKKMPFITTPERLAWTNALLECIETFLEHRFGEAGLQLMPEIKEIQDVEKLRAVYRAINTATSPQELRRLWAPGA